MVHSHKDTYNLRMLLQIAYYRFLPAVTLLMLYDKKDGMHTHGRHLSLLTAIFTAFSAQFPVIGLVCNLAAITFVCI